MNSPESAADEQLDKLRGLVTTATQRLLGDTIDVTDEHWRQPSGLPDWSRAHVAAHIASQADALTRLTSWACTGERQEMYASPEAREAEIEAGATRSGLEIQIELDTSANRLEQGFDAIADAGAWDHEVEMRGGLRVPARLLPLGRLLEVTIHHVDLDIGFEIGDIDAPTAEWLLEWSSFRLRHRDEFPKLELHADSGFTTTVGNSGEPITISGSSANLLGWLTKRLPASAVTGDDGLDLPAF
jgi:maleylpyruvate isomerase